MPCASLKKTHEYCPLAAPCRPWSDVSFSVRNLPVRAFSYRAQGFSTPLPWLVEEVPVESWEDQLICSEKDRKHHVPNSSQTAVAILLYSTAAGKCCVSFLVSSSVDNNK